MPISAFQWRRNETVRVPRCRAVKDGDLKVSGLLFVLLFSSLEVATFGQQPCVPTYQSDPTFTKTFGCAIPDDYTNQSTQAWIVNFPDGVQVRPAVVANGQCAVLYRCGRANPIGTKSCYGSFDAPIVGTGSWSQTSHDSQVVIGSTKSCPFYSEIPAVSTFYCQTATVRTNLQAHPCESQQQTCYGIQCSNGACLPNPQPYCSNGPPEYCCTGAPGEVQQGDGGCCPFIGVSPIVIDTSNQGFHLTSQADGVRFSITSGHAPIAMSWTRRGYDNAWLALDRNGNGLIDNMTELFGNFTPQPTSSSPNGFLALAVFDDPRNGGNGNGQIDPGDAVYSSLRLWIDKNHDGVSQPTELFTLASMGVLSINLHYAKSSYIDVYGNAFRYKSTLRDSTDLPYDERCYDVFLQTDVKR